MWAQILPCLNQASASPFGKMQAVDSQSVDKVYVVVKHQYGVIFFAWSNKTPYGVFRGIARYANPSASGIEGEGNLLPDSMPA